MQWLGYVVVALALAVLGQGLILRIRPSQNALAAFIVSGVVVGLWLLAALHHLYGPIIGECGALLYAFICELYIFLFTFVASSISANILLCLRTSAMSRPEVDLRYDNRELVRRRITGLCSIAAIKELNGNLTPSARGIKLANLFNAARRFFGHE